MAFTQSQLDALESAFEAFNSPGSRDKIQGAAEYINDAASDKTAPEVVRKRAQQMLEDDVDRKDIPKKLRSSDAKVGKADIGFSKLTIWATQSLKPRCVYLPLTSCLSGRRRWVYLR